MYLDVLIAGSCARELPPNTDWQNENRLTAFPDRAASSAHCYTFDVYVSSSVFLNLDLLATNGVTLGACIAFI